MLCFGIAAHLMLKQDKQWVSWIRFVSTGAKHNNIWWNIEVTLPQPLGLIVSSMEKKQKFKKHCVYIP